MGRRSERGVSSADTLRETDKRMFAAHYPFIRFSIR
jgi:hypothetical protein